MRKCARRAVLTITMLVLFNIVYVPASIQSHEMPVSQRNAPISAASIADPALSDLPFENTEQAWTDQEVDRVLSALLKLPKIFYSNGALVGFKRVKERSGEGFWAWYSQDSGYIYFSDTAFSSDKSMIQDFWRRFKYCSILDFGCDMYSFDFIVAHEAAHSIHTAHPRIIDAFAEAAGYLKDDRGQWGICSAPACIPPTKYAETSILEDFAESAAIYRFDPEKLGSNSSRSGFMSTTIFNGDGIIPIIEVAAPILYNLRDLPPGVADYPLPRNSSEAGQYELLARRLLQEGEVDQALAVYTAMIRANPGSAGALEARARIALGKSMYQLAYTDLTQLIQINENDGRPPRPSIHRLRAQALRGLGRDDLAQQDELIANGAQPPAQTSNPAPAADSPAPSDSVAQSGPCPVGVPSPGDLLTTPDRGVVYLYVTGALHPIPDEETFNARGFSWDAIKTVSPECLATMAIREPLPSVKASSASAPQPEPSPWAVTLELSTTRPASGEDVRVKARTSRPVDGTGYSIYIWASWDLAVQRGYEPGYHASCVSTSGNECMVTYSSKPIDSAGSVTFIAMVQRPSNVMGQDKVAESSPITASWSGGSTTASSPQGSQPWSPPSDLRITLSSSESNPSPGATVTLTARTNYPVGWPYKIMIWFNEDGVPAGHQSCERAGNEPPINVCEVTVRNDSPKKLDGYAYVAHRDSGQQVATSNELIVMWGGGSTTTSSSVQWLVTIEADKYEVRVGESVTITARSNRPVGGRYYLGGGDTYASGEWINEARNMVCDTDKAVSSCDLGDHVWAEPRTAYFRAVIYYKRNPNSRDVSDPAVAYSDVIKVRWIPRSGR